MLLISMELLACTLTIYEGFLCSCLLHLTTLRAQLRQSTLLWYYFLTIPACSETPICVTERMEGGARPGSPWVKQYLGPLVLGPSSTWGFQSQGFLVLGSTSPTDEKLMQIPLVLRSICPRVHQSQDLLIRPQHRGPLVLGSTSPSAHLSREDRSVALFFSNPMKASLKFFQDNWTLG